MSLYISLPIMQLGSATSTRCIVNNNKQYARVPENCSANKTQKKHKQSKAKQRKDLCIQKWRIPQKETTITNH